MVFYGDSSDTLSASERGSSISIANALVNGRLWKLKTEKSSTVCRKQFFEERTRMSLSLGHRQPNRPRAFLRLWRGAATDSSPIVWRINGYRATLLVWTPEEWAELDVPPADAQYHPSGIWCALRVE